MNITRRYCPQCKHLSTSHDPFGCQGPTCGCRLEPAQIHTALPDPCPCRRPTGDRPVALTASLRTVLHAIAAGTTYRHIGRAMGVSECTVKGHAGRLFAALGANDRAHAVAIGYELGLLRIGDVAVTR